jgi:hypothetical protein
MEAVVIQRNLLLCLKNLELSVGSILALDEFERLPIDFLAGIIKEGENEEKNEDSQWEEFLPLSSKVEVAQGCDDGSNECSSLPVREKRDKDKIDE